MPITAIRKEMIENGEIVTTIKATWAIENGKNPKLAQVLYI